MCLHETLVVLPSYLTDKVNKFFQEVRDCEECINPHTGNSLDGFYEENECIVKKRSTIQQLLDSVKARSDLILQKMNDSLFGEDDEIMIFSKN